MIVDISALKDLPLSLALNEDAARLAKLDKGVILLGQVFADLNVMQGDHIYYFTGHTRCDANMICSRCAESYRTTLQGEVDFSIREVDDGRPVDMDDVPENELLVPANATQVDITTPVREALILAIPLQPLCREDCRGICPICGVNRNEKSCDCKVEKTDSRWDGLRDLLK